MLNRGSVELGLRDALHGRRFNRRGARPMRIASKVSQSFASGEEGARDGLTEIQTGQRRIDHLVDVHHHFGRQVGDVDACPRPQLGASRTGQDKLHSYAVRT